MSHLKPSEFLILGIGTLSPFVKILALSSKILAPFVEILAPFGPTLAESGTHGFEA